MFQPQGGGSPPTGDVCPPWLRERLARAGGWLPWNEVMQAALYDPAHGYYAGGPRRIGRGGDFYTAVSVGPLYGRLLAELAAQVWQKSGCPQRFTLAEQAAHDGQLMADLLAAIQQQHPHLAASAEVTLIEPQSAYHAVQETTVRAVWPGPLRWIATAGELDCAAGLLVCNELLDALPVHRVRRGSDSWLELGVELATDGTLDWAARPITDAGLRTQADTLPPDLPEGYTTEIQCAVGDWMRQLGGSGFCGTVCIADYGLDAEDYFSAERPDGTLRRYWQHRMDDRVLEDLGQADLTCHVNFTALNTAAREAGFEVAVDSDQGRFLTRLAEPWLRSLEGRAPSRETAALLRQFQSLTHPGIMGRSFRMLLLERKALL